MKKFVFTAAVLCFVLTIDTFAQSSNATLGGTVADAAGALIPGVTVSAHNVGTGIVNETVTNETGTYQFSNLQTGSRFSAVDVLDGLWNYLAGRILPAAAGLAVVGAIFNFVTHRPAMRLIAASLGFLTVSALWRLVQQMM